MSIPRVTLSLHLKNKISINLLPLACELILVRFYFAIIDELFVRSARSLLESDKLLVQLQSMAGRPTFKCRKIVIEPAVDALLSVSKVINVASMEMKNNVLARGEKRISCRVAENANRTKSK